MPLLNLFWAMLWLFLLVAWIWLLFVIVTDIFRSDDLSGMAKALWLLFIVFLPLLGVLVYVVVRGDTMQERALRQAAERELRTRDYITSVASSGGSTADELSKLAELRSSGALTEGEFQAQKAKLLAADRPRA